GLQLAEKILEKKPHIDIVFVTAYNEYAVTAFELSAIDYLMKPVKPERLQKTVGRLREEKKIQTFVEEKTNKLRIRLGYSVSFALEDNAFEPLKWRTAKARELFLYLLQNHNTFVHKGTIMEMIWGVDELDRGYSILYTTVYNVRKALQTYKDHLELQNTNDGYVLRLNNVEVDLHEWEKQINSLPEDVNNATIDQYVNAMELNSGPYLDEYDYIWIESEKQNLENLWIVNAQKVANYYNENEKTTEAIEWFEQLAKRVPELEETYLSLMEIYSKVSKHHLVTQQYDEYVKVQRSYGLGPSLKVKKWYTEYLERA